MKTSVEKTSVKKISVKLFAVAKQIAGAEQLEVELPPGATLGQLRRLLAEACPALEPVLRHAVFAVDREYCSDDSPVGFGSEVACIPPVSGG